MKSYKPLEGRDVLDVPEVHGTENVLSIYLWAECVDAAVVDMKSCRLFPTPRLLSDNGTSEP